MPQSFSVLIVEDDNDARKNMEDILSLDGYRSRTASRCLDAINAVETEPFDAVIVDWRLPDENADQLIPIILKLQPNALVVVVTGMRDFDTAVTALRSGAYDFLLKPINPDALRAVLGRILERKQHLAAIDDAHQMLLINERLAAIGQMVTGLAHESRNAFQRSHACLAELTLDLQDMPESLLLVQKVQKALDDVHMLLEEVRNYSAPIILDRTNSSLESLVVETWQQIMEAKKIDNPVPLAVHTAEDFPDTCFFDRDRMQQVLRNLLENACFACSKPEAIVVNLIVKKSKRPTIRIEVIDDGEGVELDDQASIFAPFFTTKTKGTGLGLAVSRRLVEAHSGRIFIDPKYDKGAKLVVEIPFQKHQRSERIRTPG